MSAVTYFVRMRAREGQADRVLELLLTNPRRIEEGERGNIVFAVHRSTEDPSEFWLYETWTHEAAVEAHEGGEAFRRYKDALRPLIDPDSLVFGNTVPIQGRRAGRERQVQDGDPDAVDQDPRVAQVRNVDERVRVEIDDRPADQGEDDPCQREDQREPGDAGRGQAARPEDQPPQDAHDRNQRVGQIVGDQRPALQVEQLRQHRV